MVNVRLYHSRCFSLHGLHHARERRFNGNGHKDLTVELGGLAGLLFGDGVLPEPVQIQPFALGPFGAAGIPGCALSGETSLAQRVISGPLAGCHAAAASRLAHGLNASTQITAAPAEKRRSPIWSGAVLEPSK